MEVVVEVNIIILTQKCCHLEEILGVILKTTHQQKNFTALLQHTMTEAFGFLVDASRELILPVTLI